jgi:hypothetical protein
MIEKATILNGPNLKRKGDNNNQKNKKARFSKWKKITKLNSKIT